MTTAWHVGLSDRVVDEYTPWGSDYYVIRADTFLGMGLDGSAAALVHTPIFILVVFLTSAVAFVL
jgi:hypothetical protein